MGDIWAEIYHHGIKGQEWGDRNGPPYPLDRNAKRQEAKKRKAAERIKRKAAKKRKRMKKAEEKIKANEAKKAAAEEKRKEDAKKRRQGYLKSATATYKHRHEFTQEEIDQALKRFQWEKQLRDLSQHEIQNGLKTVNGFLNYAEAGIRGWNMVARVTNGFMRDEGYLPYVNAPANAKNKGKKKES